MFTGLVETLGTIVSFEKVRGAGVLGIRPDLDNFCPMPGASVAIDGVCLTLEHARGDVLYFTAVAETLSRTTLGHARASVRVNLEQAMQASGRFDGHMVLGHVDGKGAIVADHPEGTGILRKVRVPEGCIPFMTEKGSVAIDGISLTIAKVEGDIITIALIPRTLEATTMSQKRVGEMVNIEGDVLARYVFGILTTGGNHRVARQNPTPDSKVQNGGKSLLEQMERAGF